MRRRKRQPIEKIPVPLTELRSQHPNAQRSVVYVQRFEGEDVGNLLRGVLMAAIEAAGGNNGLGLHEGGAELRMKTGEILEAVWFGPKEEEMNVGARLFAKTTGRLLAAYDGSGNLCLMSGAVLSASNSEAFQW